nr:OB-fold domain-containing protein [Gordonia rhizosphera]
MPVPTPTSQPFWDALREHRIMIQYSPSLGEYVFYPRNRAPRTLADDLEWRTISGEATLYSFTIAHVPVAPQFADAVPQILAIGQWTEGPRFSTELVDADVDRMSVGMALQPVFCDHPEHGITMLRYRPAGQRG